MTVSKDEMLTSFIKYWAGMDLYDQAVEENNVTLGFIAGWMEAIASIIDQNEKTTINQ